MAGMIDSGAAAPTSAETLAAMVAASVARLAQDLMEFSSERVADVVERVGDMLGGLLSVEDTPKQVKELLERADAAVANLAQATGGALSAGGEQHQTHKPFPAPIAPAPSPVMPSLPVPVAPGRTSRKPKVTPDATRSVVRSDHRERSRL
jgi:hypothetical protein